MNKESMPPKFFPQSSDLLPGQNPLTKHCASAGLMVSENPLMMKAIRSATPHAGIEAIGAQ